MARKVRLGTKKRIEQKAQIWGKPTKTHRAGVSVDELYGIRQKRSATTFLQQRIMETVQQKYVTFHYIGWFLQWLTIILI